MIATLLRHLVVMTCHRDQTLLDTSIIEALREVVGVRQVRVFDIVKLHDDLYLHPRAWLENSGDVDNARVVSVNESDPDLHCGDRVSSHPILLACINARLLLAQEVIPGNGIRLWLPVWLNDKITTCLEICNPRPYSKSKIKAIEGIMNIYRNYQNLLDYSERDSLTALLNRKTFDERFSRMVSAHAREEDVTDSQRPERRQYAGIQEHWLAVIDIDHFKRVNDQFGHLYGDEVLILIANRLRSSFRSQDRVFRFGGEEFVILLRSSTLEDAIKIFERFRANVENHAFPQIGTVTVSVGFAKISNETPVVILGHADQALYYAKANGRNRVCHYDELVKSGLLHSEISNESVEFFFDPP